MTKQLNYDKFNILQTLLDSGPERTNDQLATDVEFWYEKLSEEVPEEVKEEADPAKPTLLNEVLTDFVNVPADFLRGFYGGRK